MMSRSRWVPTRWTSWPLSQSGVARAEAITPAPSTAITVMVSPGKAGPTLRAGWVLAAEVSDRLVHEVLHRRGRADVLVQVKSIFLMPGMVRLDDPVGVHHGRRGRLDVRIDAGADRGEHRRAEHRAFGDLCHCDWRVRDVRMHLHPQVALRRATGDHNLLRLEVRAAHRLEDGLRAVADALEQRSEYVPGGVTERQPPKHPAGQRVGVRRPAALEVVQRDQPVAADRDLDSLLVQHQVRVDAALLGLGDLVAGIAILKPRDQGAGRGLPALDG